MLGSPRRLFPTLVAPLALALYPATGPRSAPPAAPGPPVCDRDNAGLVLAEGFCALLVAEDLGPVRQLAVAPDGVLYAAVRGGRVGLSGGVLAFRDADGDGRPEQRADFGARGGNDVKLHAAYLYLTLDDRVLRYRLSPGRLAPEGRAETVVRDLPDDGDHRAKSLAFGRGDTMFVSIGSATNSCQRENRSPRSPGVDPCRELERHAGIWAFSARVNQRFADGRRYATGLRNPAAIAVNSLDGQLWAAIQGRDQLSANWGFSDQVNAEDPAEELVQVRLGDDFGWPYCYYSNIAKNKVLAPEYGGDGRKVARCESAKDPALAFPGHWAPLALAFQPTDGMGVGYRGGLFVAFHGSWNRAPLPQAGYRVVFVPFRAGRPTGGYSTFATGAAGPTSLRASGVAVAPDGALYIADDQNGKIWKVVKGGER